MTDCRLVFFSFLCRGKHSIVQGSWCFDFFKLKLQLQKQHNCYNCLPFENKQTLWYLRQSSILITIGVTWPDYLHYITAKGCSRLTFISCELSARKNPKSCLHSIIWGWRKQNKVICSYMPIIDSTKTSLTLFYIMWRLKSHSRAASSEHVLHSHNSIASNSGWNFNENNDPVKHSFLTCSNALLHNHQDMKRLVAGRTDPSKAKLSCDSLMTLKLLQG